MPDEQFLERLMSEYGDSILRLCYLYLKDYQLAEDAAQETFLKAMRSYSSFRGQSSEKTWLTRIAINCCKNIMRTQWFRAARETLNEPVTDSGAQPIEAFLEKDSLSAAIMQLRPKERQVILLYYYQELSLREIAEVTGKPENTVAQQLSRARRQLKTIYKEENEYDECKTKN